MDEGLRTHLERILIKLLKPIVVIGSGFGGLSAGALLAKEGQKALVVEQGEGPGGYAHVFKRGPYTFDLGISVFPNGHDHAVRAAEAVPGAVQAAA